MVDILRILAGVELLALTVGFWAFTLLFHVLSDWKSTAMGKHFMSLMVCCDLVLTWSWVNVMFMPPLGVRIGVALVLYGALTFVVWRQVRILIKMQVLARSSNKVATHRVMEDSDADSTS
jgi:hypothetical protein